MLSKSTLIALAAAFAATLAREDAKMVVTDVDDAFGHAVSSWFWIPCRQLPHATTTPAVRLVLG